MAKGFVRNIEDLKKTGGYLIRDPEGEVNQTLVVTVKPGESHPVGCHDNEEEYYFIYQGVGEVMLDGKPHIVKANDFIFVPRNCTHSTRCLSEEDLVYLCVAVFLDRKPEL